jgi:hypothetical protein
MRDNYKKVGPIFIVGAPRSGTTMLQYRLRNHPRISLPTGESHFIIPLCQNSTKFEDLSKIENVRAVLAAMYKQSAEFLNSDLHGIKFDMDKLARELYAEGRNSIPAIISGVFEKNARGEGKVRWGDKTPYYVLHMTKLLEWFPDAQIIHIIRDGRDVALSLFGRRHDFGVYNVYHAAKYWQQYVEVGCETGAQLESNVYMEVRFEDILNDPTGSFKKICAFLGEEYNDIMFNIHPVEDPGKTPLVHQPILAGNKEKWRRGMTSWQVWIFEAAAGGTLERLGYQLNTSSIRLPLILRVLYRAHNRIMQVFWRNRLRR